MKKLLLIIMSMLLGGILASIFIINTAKITTIEKTDTGELIHYNLLGQEFNYYYEMGE